MKWFKHSANASRELPIREIIQKYGYHGIGVFWCIMEHVVLTDGTCTVAELQRMFASRKYGNDFVRSLIFDYGCFVVNTHAQVRLSDELPTVSTSNGAVNGTSNGAVNGTTNGTVNGTSNGAVNDVSNARTYNIKTRKDKEKDEDDNKRSSSSTSGPIRIEDPDAEQLKEAVLAKNGQHPLHMYEEGFIKAPVLKPEWFADMKTKFGAKSEQLEKYWTDIVDIFRREYVCKGLWDKPVTEGMAYNYLYHFVCLFQETKAMVLEAINQYSEHDQKHLNDDFMSTYFGRPLPDDAPPRPSHTADWDGGEWYEPRTLRGGKRNPNYNIYATS